MWPAMAGFFGDPLSCAGGGGEHSLFLGAHQHPYKSVDYFLQF